MPPLEPPLLSNHHFSHSCCCCNILHPLPPFVLPLSLSSLCECESRLQIKSHLKASPPSPCASCVPCFLVSHPLHSTTLTGTLALPPGPAFMKPHPYRDLFGLCLGYAHSPPLFFSLCACQHVLTSSCMRMWGKRSSLKVDKLARQATAATLSHVEGPVLCKIHTINIPQQ